MVRTKYEKCPKCGKGFTIDDPCPQYNSSVAGPHVIETFKYKCDRCGYTWHEEIPNPKNSTKEVK